jgi:hypothetical protein
MGRLMSFTVVAISLIPTGCEKLREPLTVAEAKQKYDEAAKTCTDWLREVDDHPEFQKSDEIEDTQRKTKKLCETAINDASIDIVVAEKHAKLADSRQSTTDANEQISHLTPCQQYHLSNPGDTKPCKDDNSAYQDHKEEK